jgi:hypothetical protein
LAIAFNSVPQPLWEQVLLAVRFVSLAMIHRHAVAIGHLTIIVQSMAVCRSSHQRTAQIATCRQRLNADQKQQHCCEEDLLRQFSLLSSANGSDSSSNARFVFKQPTSMIVASDALVQQNAGALAQKSASTQFFYDLDVEMDSTEIVVPNTLPFTTTELNQCASHLAIRQGKPTAAVDFMMASGVVLASSKYISSFFSYTNCDTRKALFLHQRLS